MTPEQAEKERMIITQAMKTVGELIPNTGFIVLAVKPDLAGGKDAYMMQVVTSLRPTFTLSVLRRAVNSTARNLSKMSKQMMKVPDDPNDL